MGNPCTTLMDKITILMDENNHLGPPDVYATGPSQVPQLSTLTFDTVALGLGGGESKQLHVALWGILLPCLSTES